MFLSLVYKKHKTILMSNRSIFILCFFIVKDKHFYDMYFSQNVGILKKHTFNSLNTLKYKD